MVKVTIYPNVIILNHHNKTTLSSICQSAGILNKFYKWHFIHLAICWNFQKNLQMAKNLQLIGTNFLYQWSKSLSIQTSSSSIIITKQHYKRSLSMVKVTQSCERSFIIRITAQSSLSLTLHSRLFRCPIANTQVATVGILCRVSFQNRKGLVVGKTIKLVVASSVP